jgi:DNA-directed RNA polymerase specialized sigma24 family protein
VKEPDFDDIVITVMSQISEQAGDFVYRPGKRAFRSFLATVTYRRCIELQRFRERRSKVNVPEPEDIDAVRDGAIRINGKLIPDELTGEITRLNEEHDMTVGRALALDKLRSSKKLTKRQLQIFEKLAMGVLPADVCSQLGVSTTQIYNARSLAMPFYEKALLEAKKELDSPTEMPPALAK